VKKRYGIAFVLLGVSGIIVALLYLFNAPELVSRYITACLSILVMAYGIYLFVRLNLDFASKHAHPEKHSNKTNN
jgi:uncharacterized membrane protein YczE